MVNLACLMEVEHLDKAFLEMQEAEAQQKLAAQMVADTAEME